MKFFSLVVFLSVSNMLFATDAIELKKALGKLCSEKRICFKADVYAYANETDSAILINSSIKHRKNKVWYMNFFNTEYFMSDKELIVVNNKRKEISYQSIKKSNDIPMEFMADSSLIKNSDSIIEVFRDASSVKYSVFRKDNSNISHAEILVDINKNEIKEITYHYSAKVGDLHKVKLKYTYGMNDEIPEKALKRKRYVSGLNKKLTVSKKYFDYKLISVS